MNRVRPPPGGRRPPEADSAWTSVLDNPLLAGAGVFLAASTLFPGSGGGGLSGIISILPVVIVGGAVLGVVSILKK